MAIPYAYEFRDAYPAGVWWVSAEDAVSLSIGLAALARGLSPAWQATPDEPAAGWTVAWLRHWPGWLLILDDGDARPARPARGRVIPAGRLSSDGVGSRIGCHDH